MIAATLRPAANATNQTPTARRLIPFSRTPLTSANERRSTLSPISTKNTGTRIELMGETISSNLSLLIWE